MSRDHEGIRWMKTAGMPVFFLMTAVLCELKIPVLIVSGIVSAVMMPVLHHQKKKEEEESRCLEESAFYMEQLIYSFRKHYKISGALRDLSQITEGKLHRCIVTARKHLDGQEEDDLFRYTFSCIEQEYGNHLMYLLHGFLIRVEEQGGDCIPALELLMNQLRDWKKNQKAFRSRNMSIKGRLTFSIVLSCLICISVVRMMPLVTGVTNLMAYQICTGAGLIIFQLLYLLFRTMSVGIEYEKRDSAGGSRQSERMEKLYSRLDSPVHGMRYWNTVRILEREIRMHFPEWMFDMILRLQTENVQTAIFRSLDDAPEVLVRSLFQLIRQQQADPVSIQPYLDFLKEFNLPEIHAVMMQLYAINDMGKEEIQEQIYAMLDQNQRLTEVAAELKMDSVLSWMGLLAAVPMLVSVVVLVINLSLMLFSFLGDMYHL